MPWELFWEDKEDGGSSEDDWSSEEDWPGPSTAPVQAPQLSAVPAPVLAPQRPVPIPAPTPVPILTLAPAPVPSLAPAPAPASVPASAPAPAPAPVPRSTPTGRPPDLPTLSGRPPGRPPDPPALAPSAQVCLRPSHDPFPCRSLMLLYVVADIKDSWLPRSRLSSTCPAPRSSSPLTATVTVTFCPVGLYNDPFHFTKAQGLSPTLTGSSYIVRERDSVDLSCVVSRSPPFSDCIFSLVDKKANTYKAPSCQLSLTGEELMRWSGLVTLPAIIRVNCYTADKPSQQSQSVSVIVHAPAVTAAPPPPPWPHLKISPAVLREQHSSDDL
ncbi:putative uncharacterized protein DDB_G0290521 [Alosa alosa]|uniref:putative uncharacterized protein DDB_G0290521 n=1 Tax=Alosa alosa TaxID=278164 RepID=UPI0020152E44|nr:putative uncharacterized protein DDB_G0290521 [Alosa alosa]